VSGAAPSHPTKQIDLNGRWRLARLTEREFKAVADVIREGKELKPGRARLGP
jgi:hypothetical protein